MTCHTLIENQSIRPQIRRAAPSIPASTPPGGVLPPFPLPVCPTPITISGLPKAGS